ncbi:MAG: methyl-accepting chemotaxis protein [Vogesella sp.]|uniref:methyl-accepting chemotaxis protein n=1 Tax=Vogesella sp. TaxID=1904252 RepID=UPI00391CE750
MKVKQLLILGFGVLLTLIAASSILAVTRLNAIIDSGWEITENHMPRAAAVNKVFDNLNATARGVRTAMLADDPQIALQQVRELDEQLGNIDEAFAVLKQRPPEDESIAMQAALLKADADYRARLKQFVALFNAGQLPEAKTYLFTQLREAQMAYQKAVEALVAYEEGNAREHGEHLQTEAKSSLLVTQGFLAASLIIGLLAAYLIGRSLFRVIGGEPSEAAQLMKELAQGEVTSSLNVTDKDNSSLFYYIKQAADKALENIRVRNALDTAATNVMIADANGIVVYTNGAVMNMLAAAEADIRKELPGFSARNIIGSNIDGFHKRPEHQRNMLATMRGSHQAQINVGGRSFTLVATPMTSAGGKAIGTIVEWQDITEQLRQQNLDKERRLEEQRLLEENTRIRKALDNVSSNVMIADNNRTIIYMNRSVQEMLQTAEADIKRVLPNFDTRKLLGGSMDGFHRNPAHQRDLLAALQTTHSSQINIGGRTFRLVANPVFSDSGERIGSVVEWTDRTEEVRVEKEVSEVVGAAANGDFSQRIPLDGKTGFFATLSGQVNQLMDVTSRGLGDIAQVLSGLAAGDLTRTIEAEYDGMFGQLRDDTNLTVSRLKEIVTNIKEATDAINTAAQEISAGNVNLSSRTEQQAASLEETASSMEEITSTVKQNAENSRKANSLAVGASDIASRGGDVVGRVVSTMNEINESATKIVDIISVIDGIAFQTNILALNAAVEAARAGEQGRGFAVVASEVRNLAQRSAAAAKEIKGLIGDSVEKVESGTRLVDEAGRTMEEIVSSIRRVTDIMSEISAASIEQSSGIEQVNLAVSQMDENTQKNAALVEEAAAAAESLEEQAANLRDAVAIFKVDQHAAKPVRSERKPVTVARAIAVSEPVQRKALPLSNPHPVRPVATDEGEWEEF